MVLWHLLQQDRVGRAQVLKGHDEQWHHLLDEGAPGVRSGIDCIKPGNLGESVLLVPAQCCTVPDMMTTSPALASACRTNTQIQIHDYKYTNTRIHNLSTGWARCQNSVSWGQAGECWDPGMKEVAPLLGVKSVRAVMKVSDRERVQPVTGHRGRWWG
jgi:hypothetical protein